MAFIVDEYVGLDIDEAPSCRDESRPTYATKISVYNLRVTTVQVRETRSHFVELEDDLRW